MLPRRGGDGAHCSKSLKPASRSLAVEDSAAAIVDPRKATQNGTKSPRKASQPYRSARGPRGRGSLGAELLRRRGGCEEKRLLKVVVMEEEQPSAWRLGLAHPWSHMTSAPASETTARATQGGGATAASAVLASSARIRTPIVSPGDAFRVVWVRTQAPPTPGEARLAR